MHHDIEIELVANEPSPPKPMPVMTIDDTVRYFSKAGAVTVTFPKLSPFSLEDKQGSNISTPTEPFPVVVREGTFSCGCVITRPDGTQVGWGIGSSTAGGEHV